MKRGKNRGSRGYGEERGGKKRWGRLKWGSFNPDEAHTMSGHWVKTDPTMGSVNRNRGLIKKNQTIFPD